MISIFIYEINTSSNTFEFKIILFPELITIQINNAFVAMENPFDCVFGLPTKVEEIRRPVPATLPRKHSRKHRRSQRRHQNHQQDEYS